VVGGLDSLIGAVAFGIGTGLVLALVTGYGEAGDAPIIVLILLTVLALSWLRMCVALGGFFVAVDHVDRHHAAAFDHPTLGAFAKGALCATAPWALAWPLEVAATQAQSSLHGAGGGVRARLAAIVRDRGAAGLFRGAGPGLLRSVVGNGAALAAFELCRARLAPQA
jgi:hypothetical protein